MTKNKIIIGIIREILGDISDYKIIVDDNGWIFIIFESSVFHIKYYRGIKKLYIVLPNMVYINISINQLTIYPPI